MWRRFFVFLILGVAIPAGPADAAVSDEMIAAFASVCVQEFGDLDRISAAARRRGFRVVPVMRRLEQSLVSRRGDLFLVYRGAPDGVMSPIPQCLVEVPGVSATEYAAIVSEVQSRLGLEQGNSRTSHEARHTEWIWRDAAGFRFLIRLTAETLLGERRLRLSFGRETD